MYLSYFLAAMSKAFLLVTLLCLVAAVLAVAPPFKEIPKPVLPTFKVASGSTGFGRNRRSVNLDESSTEDSENDQETDQAEASEEEISKEPRSNTLIPKKLRPMFLAKYNAGAAQNTWRRSVDLAEAVDENVEPEEDEDESEQPDSADEDIANLEVVVVGNSDLERDPIRARAVSRRKNRSAESEESYEAEAVDGESIRARGISYTGRKSRSVESNEAETDIEETEEASIKKRGVAPPKPPSKRKKCLPRLTSAQLKSMF